MKFEIFLTRILVTSLFMVYSHLFGGIYGSFVDRDGLKKYSLYPIIKKITIYNCRFKLFIYATITIVNN